MTTAISIDIETMSTAPTAAIASIGACRFAIGGDGIGDWVGDTFHMHVSLANCQRHGLAIDASTVLWWIKQGDDAKAALLGGQQDAAPLVTALEALANFIDATDDGGPEKPTIWANGASFDLPILANAYRTVGMPLPWKFWEERDLRTLKALRPECRIPHAGIAHHALDDAVHQARLIQAIHKHLTEALA
jgi:hypothetical protein